MSFLLQEWTSKRFLEIPLIPWKKPVEIKGEEHISMRKTKEFARLPFSVSEAKDTQRDTVLFPHSKEFDARDAISSVKKNQSRVESLLLLLSCETRQSVQAVQTAQTVTARTLLQEKKKWHKLMKQEREDFLSPSLMYFVSPFYLRHSKKLETNPPLGGEVILRTSSLRSTDMHAFETTHTACTHDKSISADYSAVYSAQHPRESDCSVSVWASCEETSLNSTVVLPNRVRPVVLLVTSEEETLKPISTNKKTNVKKTQRISIRNSSFFRDIIIFLFCNSFTFPPSKSDQIWSNFYLLNNLCFFVSSVPLLSCFPLLFHTLLQEKTRHFLLHFKWTNTEPVRSVLSTKNSERRQLQEDLSYRNHIIIRYRWLTKRFLSSSSLCPSSWTLSVGLTIRTSLFPRVKVWILSLESTKKR